MSTKTCACHAGGTYGVCDYPGGCGSSGGCCSSRPAAIRTDAAKLANAAVDLAERHEAAPERRRPRDSDCRICLVLRPDSDPRQPHNPPVCDGDRILLDKWLGEIARLHDQLTQPEEPIVDRRRHDRYATMYFEGGIKHTWNKGSYPSDPLAPLGGVAPINSRSKAPAVSGSRERPIPIRTDLHDLTSPARGANLTDAGRAHPEDHIGHLGAATILDGWVRSWRDHLWPGQHLPDATVTELVKWLRVRLADACDRYPIIDEFAGEMKSLRGSLRNMAGETDPQPQRIEGVRCGRCRLNNVLFGLVDDTYKAECGSCGLLYTPGEYDEHIAILAGKERNNRTPAEILELTRPNRIRSSHRLAAADTPQTA